MAVRARSLFTLASVIVALGVVCAPRGLAQSETPELQLQRGQSFYAEGRFPEALAAFGQAARAEAAAIREPAQIGVVQSALRVAEFDIARSTAATLRRQRPTDAAVAALYGDAMWSGGQFDEANQAYASAIETNPDEARGHNGMARILSAKVRYVEALEHAQEAVRLVPREGDYSYTLGSVLQRMGRYEEAATAFERFISLLPKGENDDRAVFAKSSVKALRTYGKTVANRILGRADQVYVLPFRLSNEKIVVAARINRGPEIEMIVDTGAELATVSRRGAERYAVTPITFTVSAGVGEVGLRGLQIGRIDRLDLGDLHVENVPCIIKTPALQGLPSAEPESLSPLSLGLSMAIDYQKRTITLARRLPADSARPDETMSLWMTRLATVRGMVGDQHVRSFVVDTGGQVISISTDTARALALPPGVSRIALKVYGASGWDKDAYLLPGVSLAFNDIRFDRMSVVVLNLRAPSVLLGYELGGIVGHQFLSKYHVSFDLERAELRLRKTAS